MKLRKLIRKAQSVFDTGDRKNKARKKHLKHVIKKLRKREKSLRKRRAAEKSKSKASKLDDQITLAHAQRKKGLKVLKSLHKS